MSVYTMQNGTAKRKQLSDELDRLDRVIDALASNLNAAVADAVKGGAREAVREVLGELLANPATAQLLQPVGTIENPATKGRMAGVWTRIKAAAAAAVGTVARTARKVFGAVASVARTAVATVKAKVASARAKAGAVRQVLSAAWQVKKILVVGVAVGRRGDSWWEMRSLRCSLD